MTIVDGAEPVEHVASEAVEAQVQLEEDVLFAGEMVIEGGFGNTEPFGDFAQRGLVVALGIEKFEGDVEDGLPGGPAGVSFGQRLVPPPTVCCRRALLGHDP